MTRSVTFTAPFDNDDKAEMLRLSGFAPTGGTADAGVYFPDDPALAKFPSPEDSQIMVTYPITGTPTVGGRPYLKDQNGAVHTVIILGGIGVYVKNGTAVPGFGEPVAQCLVRQGEVFMQITSGIWKHVDPNGTLYNKPLPAAWTSTAPGGTPIPALAPLPIPSIIAPNATSSGPLLVGPTRTYKTLTAALAAAIPGCLIKLDPGQTLTETPPAWTVPLTLDLGGCTFDAAGHTASLARGKGLLVPAADSIIMNGIIKGVAMDQTSGQLTSAIRPDAGCGYLTIKNMKINGNQCAVGQGGFPCVITISDSDISLNGLKVNTGALTHNLYVGPECRRLTLNNVVANGTNEAHSIKYRGPELVVNGGYFASAPGKPFDLPNGAGVPFQITYATIVKGANDADHGILAHGEENADNGLAGGFITGGTIIANCQNPTIITTGGTITLTGVTKQGNAIAASGGGVVVGL